MNEDVKKRSISEKVIDILRLISFGKYPSKLYHKGRSDYTTMVPMIISLVVILGIFGAAIQIIVSMFKRTHYSSKLSILKNEDTDRIINSTLNGEPMSVFLNSV
jgi:hypothetical protein